MRHPHLSPITQVSALAVAGVLAARRGGGTGALDDALPIAVQTGESQRLVPLATARAEAAWIAGRTPDLAAEIDRAWPTAVAHPQPWDLGELCWWLHLAGDHRQIPAPVARPFALMLAGRHRAAASEWRDTCSVVGWLSFRRIIDVPFETCVAALDSWQPPGKEGELRISQSLLRGPVERDRVLGTCRIEVRMARGPLRPPLRMRLDIDRSSPTSTALELIPCRRARPTATYFRAGHRLLDSLTHALPKHAPVQ